MTVGFYCHTNRTLNHTGFSSGRCLTCKAQLLRNLGHAVHVCIIRNRGLGVYDVNSAGSRYETHPDLLTTTTLAIFPVFIVLHGSGCAENSDSQADTDLFCSVMNSVLVVTVVPDTWLNVSIKRKRLLSSRQTSNH